MGNVDGKRRVLRPRYILVTDKRYRKATVSVSHFN